MIQINNINDKAFEIIGFGKTEVKSKVYTCEVQGTKLMLRNANDRDDILVEFLDYTLYTVDSATFASIDLLQAALVDVVFKAASGGSGAVWGEITGTLSTQTDVQNALNDKQEELLSGVNIKTVGGTSLLGNGDIPLNNDFTGLNDVPEGYTGSGGFAVQVNAGETGLEFVSSGGGGGGGSLVVQSLDTQSLLINQWYSAATTKNWLYNSLTYASGGGAEPITGLRRKFFIKDKGSLNDFYLNFHAQSGGNFEVYVASFDYTSGLFDPNKQVLVHESFSYLGGAPTLKTDFNVATNTLSADSVLYIAIRSISGSDTLQGLTMYYGFEA
jgi:hypothetical protein